MGPIDQLVGIAKTAEEVGFDAIALPDSLFYMEKAAADYPYTPDGSRMWNEDTPWVDPLIAAGAMGAVTSKLFFYTNVMKLGSRNPLLLARQVGSVANLTNNRFGFGIGIAKHFALSPEQGAQTMVYLASSPEVAGVTGQYFHKCRPAIPTAEARDDAKAKKLWAESARLADLPA